VVVRTTTGDGTVKHDYHLSNTSPETPLAEFARVYCAMHRIEECIKRAKSDAGLAQYQVRTWNGWHHHQTLSLIVAWFLVQEARRGKQIHTGANSSHGATLRSLDPQYRSRMPNAQATPAFQQPHRSPQRIGARLSLQST
jgi:SRSO17 transposase